MSLIRPKRVQVAMPALFGLANYVVPLQIGGRDSSQLGVDYWALALLVLGIERS